MRILIPSILLLVAAQPVRAQCVTNVLPMSTSTRALAMGDANAAGRDDDVVFVSPAQLATARGMSASAERFDDVTTNAAVSAVTRLATGGVGIGVSLTQGRDPGCSNVLGTLPVEEQAASFAVAAAGIAQTYKRIHVGITGKFVARESGISRTSVGVADIGASRDMSAFGTPLIVAVAVQNLGRTHDRFVQATTRGVVGAALSAPAGPLDLALLGQIATTRDTPVLPAGGVELGYLWLDGYSFALRVGARRAEEHTREGNFTAGFGLVLDRLAIDYALETISGGGGSVAHRLGLRVR
jgi:hypothetical protein